jgi:hypothetical protein
MDSLKIFLLCSFVFVQISQAAKTPSKNSVVVPTDDFGYFDEVSLFKFLNSKYKRDSEEEPSGYDDEFVSSLFAKTLDNKLL